MSARIVLPWPPAALSGHAKGHWRAKAGTTKALRLKTRQVAEDAGLRFDAPGDIAVHVTFNPPNRRGDRCNFPNRMKPIFDGLADALGVNDSRFVPSFTFGEPIAGGRVIVTLGEAE